MSDLAKPLSRIANARPVVHVQLHVIPPGITRSLIKRSEVVATKSSDLLINALVVLLTNLESRVSSSLEPDKGSFKHARLLIGPVS